MGENPTKFHKNLGNVKDDDITDGEIRLIQAIMHDCETNMIDYSIKEVKAAEKIKKIWDSIKPDKQLAQDAREFIDSHPLFEAICLASGISPTEGRKRFYRRVKDKIGRRIKKRKGDDGETETEE